jgi:CDGSH iron-sulfur domain-containing protein 3
MSRNSENDCSIMVVGRRAAFRYVEEGSRMGVSLKKTLGPGMYYWCSCGKSKSEGFCDGSHNVLDPHAIAFEIKEEKMVSLCTCRKAKLMPFCDGSHRN